jgi:hypothetical protein
MSNASSEKDIFICYSRENQDFALKLYRSLKEADAKVWMDKYDIPAGMNWALAIQKGLDACKVMIVIISPESMMSDDVANEWQYYLDEKKFIIPLRLTPTKLHFQLNRLQYVDSYDQDYEDMLSQLYAELRFKGIDVSKLPEETATRADTVVVPALEEGFQRTFIGENRWYAIRMHEQRRADVKHIAVYQVAPISAITHFAPIKSIERWEGTQKFVVNFSEPAHPIGPIKYDPKGEVKPLYNLRYTTLEKLKKAKTLDNVWGD